jgi:excisionase family DNA binding protein
VVEVQTTERPRWGTYEDAKTVCGLSRWTLWRLAKKGHIRVARIGRSARVDLDSLAAFLEKRADDYARTRV